VTLLQAGALTVSQSPEPARKTGDGFKTKQWQHCSTFGKADARLVVPRPLRIWVSARRRQPSLIRRGPPTSAAKVVVRGSVCTHDKVSGGIAFAVFIEVPELLPQVLADFAFEASPVIDKSRHRLLFHN